MRDYGIWVKYRNTKGCAEEGRKGRVKPHPSSQTTQPGERRPHRRRRVKRALDSTRDPKGCQPQPQATSQSLLWLLSGSPEPRIPPPPLLGTCQLQWPYTYVLGIKFPVGFHEPIPGSRQPVSSSDPGASQVATTAGLL